MRKRRFLAWLMTMVMAIGLMPATAFAEEPATNLVKRVENANQDAVTITKSVGDKDKNGNYPITIDAYVLVE